MNGRSAHGEGSGATPGSVRRPTVRSRVASQVRRRDLRPARRRLVGLACVLACATSSAGLAKTAEHSASSGLSSLAEPVALRLGVRYRDMRERAVEANDGSLIAWFLGEDSKGGDQAWLALVWSVRQCRPLHFMVVLGENDGTADESLPGAVDLRSDPEGFQSVHRVRWRSGRRGPGHPFFELDAEGVEETVRDIYELQPEVMELRLFDAASDPSETQAVFLVDDFRTLVDYLNWRCIDKSGWMSD